MGNRLLEKYQDVIKSIKESTGIKIVSVEEVEDNQAFLAVKEVINLRLGSSPVILRDQLSQHALNISVFFKSMPILPLPPLRKKSS
jgi:hypothetical protein